MPLAHKLILGLMIAGFIVYPVVLFWGWLYSRGWEYGPMGSPVEDETPIDQHQGEDLSKAA